MQSYTLNVVTDCRASVTMRQKGNGMVVEIDPELIWDRDGLLKLSAARASGSAPDGAAGSRFRTLGSADAGPDAPSAVTGP